MVREILKLKTDNGLGANNPPFKNIEITEYSFKSPLMGIPTLTAELLWPACLDDEWTHKEYVELRGERYYIRQVQSSEISNNNVIKYKHSLDFKSEREQLLHVYFYDVVPSDIHPSNSSGHDRPNTNSTKFKFFGTPREFCDRLNCAFRYAGIGDSILNTKTSLTDIDTPVGDGYCVVLSGYGDGDLKQSQEFEWEDKYLFDALSEGFAKFKIPFCFHGKKIVFNEYIEPIEHVFKYGFDDALLSVKKNNANARIINRITFKGSSENIEYYYPNETEYGHVKIASLQSNSIITADNVKINKPNRLVSQVTSNTDVKLTVRRNIQSLPYSLEYYVGDSFRQVNFGAWQEVTYTSLAPVYAVLYRIAFDTEQYGDVTILSIPGKMWIKDYTSPISDAQIDNVKDNIISSDSFEIMGLKNSNGVTIEGHTDVINGNIKITNIPEDRYYLEFWMAWHIPASVLNADISYSSVRWQIGNIVINKSTPPEFIWVSGDKNFSNLSQLGVKLEGVEISEDLVGEGFKWTSEGYMPFQENLMPPKYRATLGAERFYNALNNTYLKPDGKTYYTFKNPYVDSNPNEYIYTDETIKPTIEGIKNTKEELFGVISGIAFDVDDNDSLKGDSGSDDKDKNDSANYAHSFFYIRLNKFDGEYGFNLFNSASQTDAMTIQMTSGKCNGCKFKIQVIEEDKLNDKQWRNPVQTKGPNKDIIYGTQSQIIDKNNPQEWQQDTTKNYIWIAVQKDAETFGVIMPNRSHEYLPVVGDTFNIINIDLPQGYTTAAEEHGMYAMLDFMENNNEEKFNFNITASRIFFAKHPDLLTLLNENSRIKIEYDGKLYEQYVSEFAIDCKDNEVLPDVKLTLANTLEPSGNFVDEVVAQAVDMTSIGKGRGGAGGGLSTELADRRYVRKDKDDRTEHRISSGTAFEVGNFVSGSQGGIMFVDPETGQSTIEVDYFKARIKAIFETLEIAHVRSIGGKLIITPGGSIDISFVEEIDNGYRCYFKQQEETEGADCRFIIGDDVICQSFNISNGTHQNASNKYFWRKVTAVSNEGSYVELSKTDCATGSDIPEIGDTICQLGSDDVSRQSAIILSTVDTFSPNITLYDGVTNFTLTGKEMVDMGVDQTTNKAYFHVYGNAYIGDKAGNSFLKYDNLLKLLEIKAKLQIGTTVGDKTLEEYIQQVSPPVEQEDIEQFVNNIVGPQLEGIQDQIDGVIESFFGFGAPTLDNYPANEWTTDELRAAHERDTYTDKTEYVDDATTPTAGQSWKWQYTSPTDYGWVKIADSDAVKALLDAAKAQDTADSKRRTFTARPTPPYDEGDIWMNATYPAGNTEKDPANKKYCNDILRCNADVHKSTGSFSIDDWELASNYTDNTLAQEAINKIEGYEYLKKALKDVTTISGGLMLSGLIRLGENNTDPNAQTVWAGHNGIYSPALGGRTIGTWWGGDMLDRFDADNNKLNEAGKRYATSLVRLDGSAYFANGNIGFNKDGSGWLGNELTGIKFTSTGAMTFGSGVIIDVTSPDGAKQTLESIANFQIGLQEFIVPCDEYGNELTWQKATQSDGKGGYLAKSIKAKVGLWSADYISARGLNANGGETSIGKNYLSELLDVSLSALSVGQILTWNGSKWVNQNAASTGWDETQLANYLTVHEYVTQNWVIAKNYLPASSYTAADILAKIKNVDGHESGLNADMLDGLHGTDFLRSLNPNIGIDANDISIYGAIKCGVIGYNLNFPDNESGTLLNFEGFYDRCNQLYFTYGIGKMYYRNSGYKSGWGAWHEIAYTTSNVASASKLLNSHNINGTSFNGTSDITTLYWGTSRNIYISDATSQNIGDATSVNGSSDYTLKLPPIISASISGNATTASALKESRTIWGQSFDGSSSVSGSMTGVTNILANGIIRTQSAGCFDVINYAGASWYNGHGAYNAQIISNSNQTPIMVAYRYGSSPDDSGDSRLFSIEILNTGAQVRFCMKSQNVMSIFDDQKLYIPAGIWSDGYISARGQNTSSDKRLKDYIGELIIDVTKIAKAPSIKFSWKDNGRKDVGSIAQYWGKVCPLLVTKNRDGMFGLQYGKTALLSAISIAKKTINLEERIAILEKENNTLKQEIKYLKTKRP